MWIDVGKLIREQVPDKDGNVLPQDLSSGSYEFRDLTNKDVGSLYEGKLVYDKTYGHVTYGCGICCAYSEALLWYNPLGIPLQSTAPNGVDGDMTCTGGGWQDVSGAFYGHWGTANTGIATVDYYASHTGHAVGSTSSSTFGKLEHAGIRQCYLYTFNPYGQDNVVCATPTGFTTQSEVNLSDGSLFFTYTWSSTTGTQADLADCTIGETVFYPGYPTTPYTWPLPMVQSTPNPTSLSGKGSNTGMQDTNGPPGSYQTPYVAATFDATQRLWWSCPCYQNGANQYFVPDITITRKVFKDTDGFWKYQITKSGYTNTFKLPNQ
jgi:hypothetical protein